MYKTIVNTRKIDNSTLYPVLIWAVFLFNSLIAMAVTDFAVFGIFIGFLAIVPLFYYILKNKKEVKLRKRGYIRKEMTFNVIDDELYVDNKKMRVSQNKFKKEIYVNDITPKVMEGKYSTRVITATFIGIVEAPYVNDFEKFLKENNVEIIQE